MSAGEGGLEERPSFPVSRSHDRPFPDTSRGVGECAGEGVGVAAALTLSCRTHRAPCQIRIHKTSMSWS